MLIYSALFHCYVTIDIQGYTATDLSPVNSGTLDLGIIKISIYHLSYKMRVRPPPLVDLLTFKTFIGKYQNLCFPTLCTEMNPSTQM